MWFAIAVVVVVSLLVYGWALVAIGDDDDDVSLADYERHDLLRQLLDR